jgi:hypothetical protein
MWAALVGNSVIGWVKTVEHGTLSILISTAARDMRYLLPQCVSAAHARSEVTVDGDLLAGALINVGLARTYGGGSKRGWCAAYQPIPGNNAS